MVIWLLMILASLAFWTEPLRYTLWLLKAVFIYLATVVQGGSMTFFVCSYIYSELELIYAIALITIPFFVLIYQVFSIIYGFAIVLRGASK
ncbi:MAG: hypothetical protein APF84_13820 [Gracilibacter sp. BRH_c7a]|nr:MAG: hypothetical protein APF84_13820 [Gracilibacter sp. BRH_c7a]